MAERSPDAMAWYVAVTTFISFRAADQVAWGKESASFALNFEGEVHHNLVIGKAQRDDLLGIVLDMLLERRGDCT